MRKQHYEKYFSKGYDLLVINATDDKITEGRLVPRTNGLREISILNAIPRFIEGSNYADNFGLQWNVFRSTQLDSYIGKPISGDRFWHNTKWDPKELAGKKVLEVGSGAGRFTEIFLKAGAKVCSLDYSNAVEANYKNNSHKGDLCLIQADLFNMPFEDNSFDFVFCHGVLQHTCDPEKAFYSIEKKLKKGGKISIDVYHKDGKIRPWKSKYLWRPITTQMNPNHLLAFLKVFIPIWLPFDTVIKCIPVLRNYLGAIIPCWNYFYMDISLREKFRWAIMDTFDALAAVYDNPVTMSEAKNWFETCGYKNCEVFEGGNGIVGNGIKP